MKKAISGTPRRGFTTPSPEGGETPSPFGVEQSPGHCTNLIEKVECSIGSAFVDGTCLGEEPKMGVDLFS